MGAKIFALGDEGPLLSHGGRVVDLVGLPADQVTLLLKVVMDGPVHGSEFLQRPHSPETQHRPLTSSERLVGIFRSIINPTTGVDMPLGIADLSRGRACRASAPSRQFWRLEDWRKSGSL